MEIFRRGYTIDQESISRLDLDVLFSIHICGASFSTYNMQSMTPDIIVNLNLHPDLNTVFKWKYP
jgi:hypothetical protein